MLKLMNSTSCLQENYLILKKKMMLRKSWMMIHTISRCLMVPAATTRWTLTRPSPSYRLSMLSLSKLFIRSPRRLLNYPSLVCPTPSSQWPGPALCSPWPPRTAPSAQWHLPRLPQWPQHVSESWPESAVRSQASCVDNSCDKAGYWQIKPGLLPEFVKWGKWTVTILTLLRMGCLVPCLKM